jgi:hypothetical protein
MACRQTVSGTLSLPSRGTFHHSLTVLSAIGHQEVFRLTGWSRQIHSKFHELAATREHTKGGPVLSPTRLSRPTVQYSKLIRLTQNFITPRQAGRPGQICLTTPHTQPLPGITCARFSLLRFRSPLLTESLLFSLPTGTKMFHFPAYPPPPYTFR